MDKNEINIGTKHRPGDIYIANDAEYLFIDVTVVTPIAPSYIQQQSKQIGYALQKAEQQKHKKYMDIGVQPKQLCILAVETFGGVNKQGKQLLQHISQQIATRNHKEYSVVMQNIRKHLSSVVMYSNINMIINCMHL